MKDPRIAKLSTQLVNYACELKEGETVIIENFGVQRELLEALIKEVYAVNAYPIVWLREPSVQRALLMGGNAEKWSAEARIDAEQMKTAQAYIGIRAGDNSYEQSDVPPSRQAIYAKHYSEAVHGKIRVPQTRWVVLRYPTSAMAQQAQMSREGFEDYYFDVCTMDYARMSAAMDPLVSLMERTDKVRIIGRGTDLSFSIKGNPAIKCDGKVNVPDGEVFTAPVKDSVNGVLQYNTPTLYQGTVFENMRLTFENGRITDAQSSDTLRCNQIFDTDPGARYVGEFALGVNPYITKAIKDTLFDEKIAGSFHFTPGCCYDECPNGNKSAIHWDLVCIQTPEYGGGEIWFDDRLIRKDGLFVPEELQGLNPDSLK